MFSKRTNNLRRTQSGFSLVQLLITVAIASVLSAFALLGITNARSIEVTISMVLMAIVGLGVLSLFAYAASNTQTAADREMASAVAQQRMEQLRSVTCLFKKVLS